MEEPLLGHLLEDNSRPHVLPSLDLVSGRGRGRGRARGRGRGRVSGGLGEVES